MRGVANGPFAGPLRTVGGLSAVNVTAECVNICSESVTPAIRNTADCLRHFPFESLRHLDIPSLLQLVYLDTQVARRRSRLRFKIHEVRVVNFEQDGHYRQPQFRMEQRIKGFELFSVLGHGSALCLVLEDDTGNDQGENAQDHKSKYAQGGSGWHNHQEKRRQGCRYYRRDGNRPEFEHGPRERTAKAHQEHNDQCQVNVQRSFNAHGATDAPSGPDKGEETCGET